MNRVPAPAAYRNGGISHWMHEADAARPTRAELQGEHESDVVIVGAGFTGLWAATYLTQLAPELQVTVVEANHVGYGASGRNGGWLSHLVPGNRAVYARGPRGTEGAVQFQRAMVESVDEVLKQASLKGIDMGQAQGGNLVVATTPAGHRRLHDRRAADLRYGLLDDEAVMLSPEETAARVNVHGAVGGLYYPVVTRINPARLVLGLADALEQDNVRIFEQSPVTQVEPGRVVTQAGAVRAGTVLVCTEGYGGPLLGRRRVIPINSSMIVTRPLSDQDWHDIGWSANECLSDAAHTFIYAQRTPDDRIAIGGRGAPYRFGSGTGGAGPIPVATVRELAARLHRYFPRASLDVDHGWSGVLGVTRDWCATVSLDRRTSVGAAYGYAGHGVTAANLAARTLVDLALGRDTDLTRLPLVDHASPTWEPEPLRWLGVHGMYRLFRIADQWEERRGSTHTSALAKVGSRLAGLHE